MSSSQPSPNPLDAMVEAIVERTITKLLPHIAKARPEWTTPKNAKDLFGEKTWRSIDEWAQRRAIKRYSVAGSPAYKTTDLDAAVERSADIQKEAEVDDLAAAARKRAARKAAG